MSADASWADWIGLVISLCAFAVAFAAWRSQAEPEVVVYAVPDPTRPTVINLIIENMGRGVARGVKFVANQAIPHEAFGIGPTAQVSKPMKSGPLIHGIPFMHPGERRIITWGQFHGLEKSLVGPIEFRATYQSKPPYWPWRRSHDTVSVIDMDSFRLADIADRNWDKKAAESLAKIADRLDLIIDRASGALRVREADAVSVADDGAGPGSDQTL